MSRLRKKILCFLYRLQVCVEQTPAPTCYWGIRAGLLFPPRRHKHRDVMMATLQEPIDGQLDALAGKHFLVAMTTGHNYETINILGYFCGFLP